MVLVTKIVFHISSKLTNMTKINHLIGNSLVQLARKMSKVSNHIIEMFLKLKQFMKEQKITNVMSVERNF